MAGMPAVACLGAWGGLSSPGSEGGDQSAVDHDVGTRDVPGPVAGEEQDDVSDLVGFGEATGGRSGRLGVDDGPGVAAVAAGHGGGDASGAEPQAGADRTGADGVDADPVSTDLLRQGLGEVGQR